MALIKKQDLAKMNTTELSTKLKDLKLELTRSHVAAHRATAKTKEIKRTIARIMTRLSSTQQEAFSK